MSLTVGKGARVMDIAHVETQASQYVQVISGSAFAGGHGDHEVTARLGAGARAVAW